MGDDIVDLSAKKESLKNKKGSYDENCLQESKAKLLKQFNNGKGAKLFLTRMEKQTKEQKLNISI